MKVRQGTRAGGRTAGDNARSSHRATAMLCVIVGAAALIHLVATWPGMLVWDSIRQYGQALSGHYDDWHPPAMTWLWRQALRVRAGPPPMLLLQVGLYWGGFGLLARAALYNGRPLSAAAITIIALMPIWLVLVGTILKDSLMAGCLLMTSGLLAERDTIGWPRRSAIMLLLIAASALRFNAVAAVVPLGLAALPASGTDRRLRTVASAALIGFASLLIIPIANRLLDARRTAVEQSLIVYDLAGITRFGGTSAFPPLPGVQDPVAVNAACYTPVSWDRYAWWGPTPCAIQFEAVRASFARQRIEPTRWWLRQVAAHPAAYAEHRLAHYRRNIRLAVGGELLPGLSFQSDPNPWELTTAPNALTSETERVAARLLATPIGWPATWIAIGLIALFVWPRGRSGGIARPLLASGLLYAASFLPLSVASEVRYHLWTMIAIALGVVCALGEAKGSAPSPRGLRRVAAE